MIQVSFALIQQGIHHIGGMGRCGQRQGLFAAGLQGDGQVFAVQPYSKAGLEVTVEDALAVQVQDSALGKTAQQGLAHPGRRNPATAGSMYSGYQFVSCRKRLQRSFR